jgi:hypothetical protein
MEKYSSIYLLVTAEMDEAIGLMYLGMGAHE